LSARTHTQYFKLLKLKQQSQHTPFNLCLFTFWWHAPWSCVILCDMHAMHSWRHCPSHISMDLHRFACLYLWSAVETTTEMNLYELRALFCHRMVVTVWKNGIFFHAKTYQMDKKFLESWNFHALKTGKLIKQKICQKRNVCLNHTWIFWYEIILTFNLVKLFKRGHLNRLSVCAIYLLLWQNENFQKESKYKL
jgi:hypothetical protein